MLEQQAHSALSEEPSTSGRDTATAPVRPINQAEPSECPPQPSSPTQVMLHLLQQQAAVEAWLCLPVTTCMHLLIHVPVRLLLPLYNHLCSVA